jgi:L-threonylcarbamoyladenylate synthase
VSVDAAVAAIERGEPVVLPTDTVYGLCASPHTEPPTRAVYRLKGRDDGKPTALVAADVDALVAAVPELRGRGEAVARALLPGPYTLIFPNPSRRFPWLTGDRPETIGVRVPAVDGEAAEVLRRVGVVLATSANLAGGPDPRRLEDVPEPIRTGAGAVVDAGELPGTPSTVLDLTGGEPRVLREGAVPAAEALAQVASALSGG